MIAVPIIMLATSGCATKKYVSQQVSPVNTRVSKLEKTTNDRIAYLNNKEQSDVSQLNERIATTDQKVSDVAAAVQQAQGTASRAMDDSAKNSAAIETLGSGVANALNYQEVEKGDVTFAFNKAILTPDAKTALDAIAAKVQGLPRAVVELVGFTDKKGSPNYNLALSRRRAEAVQRYLVMQNVPLRAIHIVGLGEEAPPEGLAADLSMVDPNPSKAELDRLARRVHIRVFGAGDITQGTASRVQQ
jgi:outer membrane protein OmpA-like peptidoglycan-associated protein